MNLKRISINPVIRRGVTFVLLAFFVAAICWWTVHIPYAPEKLLRSVPFEAGLVSVHENLFENLEELVKNPLVKEYYDDLRRQLNEQGVDIEAPFARKIIKRFTEKLVLISYTPTCPVSGKDDVWTAASWIGADSIWLRWILELKDFQGINRLEHGGPRPMWHIDSNSGISCSFAFDEGVVIVCVSRNPFAIHNVMLAYEGRLPGLRNSREKNYFSPLFTNNTDGSLGKGMADYRLFLENYPSESLFFEIDEFSEKRIAGSALLDEAGMEYSTFANTSDFSGLSLITGDSASAMFFFSQSLLSLSDLIHDQNILNGLTNVISDIVTSDPDDVIALGVFTGEFSGRFGTPPFRPTVPALMLFLRTPKMTGVIESGQRIIDYLNARFKTGLIIKPEPVQAGNYSIFPIEATSGEFLAHADPEDMPAFVHIGEWVIISSNLRGLTRLTAKIQTEAWKSEAEECRWLRQMTNSNSTIYAWLDTDSGGQSAQLMIAVYAFSIMGRTDPSAQATIAMLTTIRKWIDKIRPLGSCGIWLNLEENQPTLNFELNIKSLQPGIGML